MVRSIVVLKMARSTFSEALPKVRTWTCSVCAAAHDRDVNAARNILAAGRAVTAGGGAVRPGLALAVAAAPSGTEAGTSPGAAA
jgi:transposase